MHFSSRARLATCAASLTMAFSLSGCLGTGESVGITGPVTVQRQDQAGTVLVSPTMVAPWSEVSAALKPAFTMTGDTAASQVLPITAAMQQDTVRTFGLALGLGLPQTSTSSSMTTATSGNTSSSTTTLAPGTAPAAPVGTPLSTAAPSITAPGTVTGDPAVKYAAAANFLQQVQLLNQEIDHVAMRDGYEPYLVKFKLAVVTYQPHMAYSAHVRISLFHDHDKLGNSSDTGDVLPANTRISGILSYAETPPDTSAATPPTKLPRTKHPEPQTKRVEGTFTLTAQTTVKQDATARVPVVVPLLVADDLTVALNAQAAQSAQQLALALSAMVHGVGANLGVNRAAQALKAVTEQDLTSTLTVTREADDTLYAVIQPNNLATGDPALVTRTYDIATLVLIPREYFKNDLTTETEPALIDFATATEFRSALNGSILPYDPTKFDPNFDAMVMNFVDFKDLVTWKKYNNSYKAMYMRALIEKYGSDNNFVGFNHDIFGGNGIKFTKSQQFIPTNEERFCTNTQDIRYDCIHFIPQGARPLWALLRSTSNYSPYQSGRFQAPLPHGITVPEQTVLLMDDGTLSTTAHLGGVSGTSAASLTAIIGVSRTTTALRPSTTGHGKPVLAGTEIARYEQPAQSLTIDPASHILTLTAPSLKQLNFPPDDAASDSGGKTKPPVPTTKDTFYLRFNQIDCSSAATLCPKLTIDASAITAPATVLLSTLRTATTLAAMYHVKDAAGAASGIQLQPTSGGVVMNGAAGALSIFVTGFPGGDTTAGLTVAGVDVLSVVNSAGAALNAPGKNGFVLNGVGQYIINLTNLSSGTPFTVKVTPLAGTMPDPQQIAANGSYVALVNPTVPTTANYTSFAPSPPPAPARPAPSARKSTRTHKRTLAHPPPAR